MSIKDVTAVIDAKAIKRYCDSKKVNGNECSADCVFNGNLYCILPDILGVNGQDCYIDAEQKICEKISELCK